MSDIFVSYEKSDLPKAELLAQALAEQRWSVFWDRTIAIGSTWRRTIGKELDDARAVIVLWSAASMDSHWVLDEADDARGRNILVPILIENTKPPMGFRGIQTGNFANWNGSTSDKTFQKLVADLTKIIGPPPALTTSKEPESVPPRSESVLAEAAPQSTPKSEREVDAKPNSSQAVSNTHEPAAAQQQQIEQDKKVVEKDQVEKQPADQVQVEKERVKNEPEHVRTEVETQRREQDQTRDDSRKQLPDEALPNTTMLDQDFRLLETGASLCIFTLARPGLRGLNKLAIYLNTLQDERAIQSWHMHGWQDGRTQLKAAILFPRPQDGMVARARWKETA